MTNGNVGSEECQDSSTWAIHQSTVLWNVLLQVLGQIGTLE